MSNEKAIAEVGFQLEKGTYPTIKREIHKRGWKLLCNPPTKVRLLQVQEFYANAAMNGQDEPHPSVMTYALRLSTHPRYDEIINDICVLGAEWTRDASGMPNQLKRGDLIPAARGWYEFVRRSILPTSNNSEVTKKRAILVHCIMTGEEINIENIIASNTQRMAESMGHSTTL
ncbi:hypothetical protein PIB30_037708 [Stylosanthes scabra]|uniref:Putative plant transposon protein domain-containing protein n=1 Tax=Stylosanthes scabra TaxID=79078 RepID=A0ABU6YB48_9FABA|nr:hypothetical protein [Stylosanthes scabra]